ncbi:amidohydrolase family protein [Spongiimicrobium sp. 3-5]|uniref:amidohydrolase family protein n=1 Tax=Spongiimicrobium sp. 3-5 TaxID=3332596 RepID=UPI0039813984
MIIDSHQHFWKYNAEKHAWIDNSMKAIRRDFLPSDLRPVLQANKIDGCIAVQADQSFEETEFLLACAENDNFIKGVVGWVDLLKTDVEEQLTAFAQNNLFKGVRHIVQDEPDTYFMLRPDFQRGISLLSKFGLTYDILIYKHQLPAAIELAHRFPNQTFILDHMAKPQVSDGLENEWKSHIEQLGACQNVYCKLSGLVTETKGYRWKKEDFFPFLDTVMKAFGTDRVMFGSDWPVCLLAGSYKDVLSVISNYIETLPSADQKQIMGQNAANIYKL